MNFPDSHLKDCIYLKKSFIPEEVCNSVVKSISKEKWDLHTYQSKKKERFRYKEKELSVLNADEDIDKLITKYLLLVVSEYSKKYNLNRSELVTEFNRLRFNRYSLGQKMRPHYDHIHSLFDGNLKGIPVLSVIVNLNRDYKGSELYFWNGFFQLPLNVGDIVVFPSNFLFPHGVTECKSGIRYSAIKWFW